MAAPRLIAAHCTRRRAVRAGLVLAVAVAVAVHVARPSAPVGVATFLAVGAGAAIWAWAGAGRAARGSRLVPMLVAGGITASALGDLTYQCYEWTGRSPDVSWADIPWFASYLGLGAALLVTLLRGRGPRRVDLDAAIDVLTAMTVSVLVFWTVSIEGIVADGSTPVRVRLVWAAYPVADAILVALVLRTLADRRSRAAAGVTFAVGAGCWLVSDVGFLLMPESVAVGTWLDVGWMLGAALMARSAWRRTRPVNGRDTEPGHVLGNVALAISPLMVPPLMGVVDKSLGRVVDPTEAVLAMAVLLALAFARTARLMRSELEARAEARRSHRHYALLAANSSDAVFVVDAEGRVLDESPALAALVGIDGSVRGLAAGPLLAPVNPDEVRALFTKALSAPGEAVEAEVQIRGAGPGAWMNARLVSLLDNPDVAGVVIALHDISDRKRVEGELTHQAFHDGLTGLPNRALYLDRVEHALRRRVDSDAEPVVLYLDLDGFKSVNDNLGHDAGDQVLREVAARLSAAVRTEDTVARLGGDEFALLIESTLRPADEAAAVAERILDSLTHPIAFAEARIVLSASIGIAAGASGASGAALIRDADIAMYRAKATGKAQVVSFNPDMRAAELERLQLESDLAGALQRGEFQLVYQPVVRLDSSNVVGFEALLRWHHPTLGVVDPDRFIPLSEANGAIVPIGRWVLNTACAMGARWQRDYPRSPRLTMAVNVSARQLTDPDLVAHVTGALASSGLDPATLVLEMTETALIHDPAAAASRLHTLKELGVRLAIDDFGTGYSSLSYLRQFPVDILKIDRSFVDTITDPTHIPAIIRGLLELGRTLELETVAEGIENVIQRDGLRDEHCQLAQGYLFARPLDAVDAEAVLAQVPQATHRAL